MMPFSRLISLFTLAAAYLFGLQDAAAQSQRIESPTHRVALVELFTSEGCSSCPAADRWLSGLVDDERLWQQVVPVAFHVDYWDYIGWPDRFARPAYSQRQRDYARSGNVRSVYTPGFVVHGEEWRGWFRRPVLRLADQPPAGTIVLDVAADGAQVAASYSAGGDESGALDMHLVVLGFGLTTAVKDGENEGRILTHDFVVLGYRRIRMSGTSPHFSATSTMPETQITSPRQALAAWVSRRGEQAPLQAAGNWLR